MASSDLVMRRWPRIVLPEHLRSTHFGVVMPVALNATDCIRGYSYSRPPALLANRLTIRLLLSQTLIRCKKGFSPVGGIVFLCCTTPEWALIK